MPGWKTAIERLFINISEVIQPFYGDIRILKNNIRSRSVSCSDFKTDMHPIASWWWNGIPREFGIGLVLGNPLIGLLNIKGNHIVLNNGCRLILDFTDEENNKKFNKFILFLSIWSFAVQFSVTFIPVYMLSVLGLSYSYISVIAVTGNILGMVSVFLWGRLADRTTWTFLLKVSGFIITLCYLGWSFVTPGNAKILVFILQISLTCCNGAFQMASNNLQYNLSPQPGKTAYLGVTSAVASVISFAGAMLGSELFKLMKETDLHFYMVKVANVQILFLITGFLLTVALAVLRKQHRLINT
jgi:MFS-type transporter involved in bile tolerance (Atg22 family)